MTHQQKALHILMVSGIYPTPERPHKGTFIQVLVDSLREAGHTVDIVHPNPAQKAPSRYLQASWDVFRKTRRGRYDIVHGHYGLWCLAARLQWTTPVVASYLGDDLLGTVTTANTHSRKSLFVVGVSRWLCGLVDAVTVKSEEMKRAARGHQEKIRIIADGINLKQFQPLDRDQTRAELGWDAKRFYVLFANNPEIAVKNFPLAQAAVERIKQEGWDIELVVATGLPHDRVMQYMNASNVLILPSHAEGSPNVVKEAMACNVPVVATDVGDVRDVIRSTEGCSVCEPEPEAFAQGIKKALLHKERTTGRQDIAPFDSAMVAAKTIDLYNQILQNRHRSSAN